MRINALLSDKNRLQAVLKYVNETIILQTIS